MKCRTLFLFCFVVLVVSFSALLLPCFAAYEEIPETLQEEQSETVQLTGQEEIQQEPEPEQAQNEQTVQIEIPDEQMQLLVEFSQELEARRSAAEDDTGEMAMLEEPVIDGDIISSVQVCMGFIGGLLAVLVFSSALRNAT